MCRPAGGLAPNHRLRKVAAVVDGEAVSMKMTDSPGPMDVMPVSATEFANRFESSSIRQPVMSMAAGVVLVTSNQSAASGLLPLDQGATSEMKSLLSVVPGEPISLTSLTAVNAALTPTVLSVAAVARPAALLKVANDGPDGEAPNCTLACTVPAASKRCTWSPLVLSPTPEPV